MRKIIHFLRCYFRPLVPQVLINYLYHLPVAFLASRFYGNPGDDLEIIGVTGTDGKTTTTTLIYHILKSAHKKVAMISTVEAKIGRKSLDTGFHVTAPDPFPLQKLLRRIRSQKIHYLVLEATSHGLDQFRFYPLRPQIAVLTNITHEHLDYHGTLAKYRSAKLRLFAHAKHAVVNKDLPDFAAINSALPKVLFSTYSLVQDSQLKPADVVYSPTETTFRLDQTIFRVPLTGSYNLSNTLAAIATALLLEISPSDIKRALSTFPGVKGRLETIPNRRNLHTYIDFAHTPNALKEVLTNLSQQKKPGEKLLVIFGAAGNRDTTKRPLMGQVAAILADHLIITSEDPRDEDPQAIADAIVSGIPADSTAKVTIELSRAKAIDLAINRFAHPGDWVVSCGKGHETSLNLDGFHETPWSDQEAMQQALNRKT